MPFYFFNFPNVHLKSYIVQSITDEKTKKRISYNFNKPSLTTRQSAIEKALSERDRFRKFPDGEELIEQIKLFLEFITDSPRQNNHQPKSRIYLIDGKSNIDNQLLFLDAEAAHWFAAEQDYPSKYVIDGNKTWVVIDQLFSELYYFYN